MAHRLVKNVSIRGMVTCVPKESEENITLSVFQKGEAEKVIASTGIERRRVSPANVTTSDLCFQAAEELLRGLNWEKGDIDCLIFVSQTPDYILPATSCVLQSKLGLPITCCTLDISYGCSGWVYGLSVISSMLSSGDMKKGLLLVGDTTTKFKSRNDKTAWPLFGDAGTATALEFNQDAPELYFSLFADGNKFNAIIIKDGGFRHPFTQESLIDHDYGVGISRNNLHSEMNGMDVFQFGLTRAPECVTDVLSFSGKTVEDIDYYIFHQANRFMNEKIRRKLKIPEDKVPYSMKDFGNTSCATIPLTIDCTFKESSDISGKTMLATAFGVGLSWGSVIFQLNAIDFISLIDYDESL